MTFYIKDGRVWHAEQSVVTLCARSVRPMSLLVAVRRYSKPATRPLGFETPTFRKTRGGAQSHHDKTTAT